MRCNDERTTNVCRSVLASFSLVFKMLALSRARSSMSQSPPVPNFDLWLSTLFSVTSGPTEERAGRPLPSAFWTCETQIRRVVPFFESIIGQNRAPLRELGASRYDLSVSLQGLHLGWVSTIYTTGGHWAGQGSVLILAACILSPCEILPAQQTSLLNLSPHP